MCAAPGHLTRPYDGMPSLPPPSPPPSDFSTRVPADYVPRRPEAEERVDGVFTTPIAWNVRISYSVFPCSWISACTRTTDTIVLTRTRFKNVRIFENEYMYIYIFSQQLYFRCESLGQHISSGVCFPDKTVRIKKRYRCGFLIKHYCITQCHQFI